MAAAEAARAAQAAEALHVPPAEYAALTPAQIHRVLFHPRNKDGTVRLPGGAARRPRAGAMPHVPDAATLEEALRRLEVYYAEMRLPEADLEKAREKLRSTWGRKEGGHAARSRGRRGRQ